MSVIWWRPEERKILRELFPSAKKDEILKALKNKTWYACQKEAKELGLQRKKSKAGRRKKPPKQFVGKNQLIKLFNEDGFLTVEEISKKLNVSSDIVRRYLHKYGL